MQLGMIGLGRMGGSMVQRLLHGGHACVVFDADDARVTARPNRAPPVRNHSASSSRSSRHLARLADASRRRGGSNAAQPDAAAAARRHHHRRREFALRRRYPSGQNVRSRRSALRRRRRQRRRLGSRARVLPDDWRRGGRGGAPRPGLQDARSGRGRGPADARAQHSRRHGGPGIPALRTRRRGTLRQDGAQRHRIRAHGRVRGRLEHPRARQRRRQRAVRGRRDGAAAESRALPIRLRPARCRRVVAPRKRDWVVAARPDGRSAGQRAGPQAVLGPGIGFRRRTMDGSCGHRERDAGACPDRGAFPEIQLPRRRRLARSSAVGDALSVRRPRRAAVEPPSAPRSRGG